MKPISCGWIVHSCDHSPLATPRPADNMTHRRSTTYHLKSRGLVFSRCESFRREPVAARLCLQCEPRSGISACEEIGTLTGREKNVELMAVNIQKPHSGRVEQALTKKLAHRISEQVINRPLFGRIEVAPSLWMQKPPWG